VKSSDIREKLRELNEEQRLTRHQLDDKVKEKKSLETKAEKLKIEKLQSEKNLLEIDKKMRSVTQVLVSFSALRERWGKAFSW